MKTLLTWLCFIIAALLEVGGDALIRKGLRGQGIGLIAIGFIVLGSYGLVVNTVRWDFSRLLGVYVAFFALISVLFGSLVFKESVSTSTWIGIGIIIIGGLIIQFGQKL
jgi:small multidrug resistance family-3 protein